MTAAHGLARACGLLVLGAVFGGISTASAQRAPAGSYAALDRLPDWSGFWTNTQLATQVAEILETPAPLKPEVLAAIRAARVNDNPDPLRYCRPWQFTGLSGSFTEAVEFLFTPGRVTLTNERGLIRRIYTDGRPMPADPVPSNTGTSIGHWEGQTLVVETKGIDPRALYPGSVQGGVPIGENVTITERITLKGPDMLEFDVTTIAPALFTAPDHRTRQYKRLAKTMANEVSFCSEHDRSIELGTGKQQFDMTPPPDLPPPPPR